MPRNRVVTPDAVAETVENVDRPFCTTKDVATRLDVTKQAIRNHHKELEQSSLLEHGKVGRQRVYWLAEQEPPEQATQTETPDPPRHRDQSRHESDTADSRKGIRERLSLPSLGDPLEMWALPALTAVLGLILGVTTWILVVSPPLKMQVTIVAASLALAFLVELALAYTYMVNDRRTTHRERDNA